MGVLGKDNPELRPGEQVKESWTGEKLSTLGPYPVFPTLPSAWHQVGRLGKPGSDDMVGLARESRSRVLRMEK